MRSCAARRSAVSASNCRADGSFDRVGSRRSGDRGRRVRAAQAGAGGGARRRPRRGRRRRRGRCLGHRPGAPADERHAHRPRPGAARDGRPRCRRHRPHPRRNRARPVHGPGVRPRPGADVADGGLAAHLGRAPRRDVRREPARRRPLHPDARLAAGHRARPGGDGAGGSGRRGRVRRGRQRLARPGTGQPRARVPRDGHEAGTVDRPRFGRLAEGPGVEPRQQHGRGAVPVPRRRPSRRPGPHRRAVPALSRRTPR